MLHKSDMLEKIKETLEKADYRLVARVYHLIIGMGLIKEKDIEKE